MKEWHDLIDTLRNWTIKTCIDNQEEYNNLWDEIDNRLKVLDLILTIETDFSYEYFEDMIKGD